MNGLWGALRFLTRIPLPGRLASPWERFGAALPWFPFAGLIVGALLASLDVLARAWLAPLTSSALVVVAWLLLTGALHADGLMDTCDAVFAPVSPERRLEIMRDTAVGAFGVAGFVCVVLLKVSALASMAPEVRTAALLAAPVIGRWALVGSATLFAYGRVEGLGSPLKAAATGPTFLVASALPALLAIGLFAPLAGGLMLGLCGLTMLGLGVWFTRRLPGLTGDTYGAICELVEAVCLLVAASSLVMIR